MLRVVSNVEESRIVKTIRLDASVQAAPGQFAMLWVPGVDEFPMSVSYVGDEVGFTYQIVGDGTKALGGARPGEVIGVRGPYGRGFALSGRRILVVAGGLGIAPTAPLIEQAVRSGAKVDLVLGAKSSDELIFETRCSDAGAAVHVSTDDGSKGFKGFATELASEMLRNGDYDSAYTCGPERMIVSLLDICDKLGVPLQASIERFMKCGIGICDSCAIDGFHVCTDGPVFDDETLKRLGQLGKKKLDLAGREVSI
jgi:dihydroorotate dehydrogenase electron transfer subunit